MTEDQKKIKKYVNAVERKLKVPLKMKVRINADLGTDINARMEAGWSVDKILEDLGSPKEVADRFNAELGAERKPGGFRYIFLVLGEAAAVYAVYILAMNLYMKSMVQRQSRQQQVLRRLWIRAGCLSSCFPENDTYPDMPEQNRLTSSNFQSCLPYS